MVDRIEQARQFQELAVGNIDELRAKKDLDLMQRQSLYLGIIWALIDAAEYGEDNNLSDAELALLGRAIYQDKEAMETPYRLDDREAGAVYINLEDYITRQHVIKLLYETNDPRLDRKVGDPVREHSPGGWEVPLLDDWDVIKEDELFNAGLLLMAGSPASVGPGAARFALAPAIKVASRITGKLPSALAMRLSNHSARIVAGNTARTLSHARAAVPTGPTVGSALRGAWRGVRYPVYGAGLLAGMQLVSILDNVVNYEENREAIDATDTEVITEPIPQDRAAVAQMDFDLSQDQIIVAAPAGMSLTAPPPLQTTQPQPTGENQATARLYEATAPPNPADQSTADEDDPWIGGFGPEWPGRFATDDTYEAFDMGSPTYSSVRERRPRYRQSDYELFVTSLTENDIQNFQGLAEQAMLLNLGKSRYGQAATPGYLDQATRNAIATVMTEANANGTDWRTALQHMVQAGAEWRRRAAEDEETSLRPGYVRPAYREPDWAELVNDARWAIEEKLGRPANQWELNLLAEEMRSYKQDWYGAEVAAHRAAWEAEGRAADTGQDQITGTFQEVNPDARFDEFFRERFATEIARKDRVEEVARKTSSLMAGFDNAASIVGGR